MQLSYINEHNSYLDFFLNYINHNQKYYWKCVRVGKRCIYFLKRLSFIYKALNPYTQVPQDKLMWYKNRTKHGVKNQPSPLKKKAKTEADQP